MSLPLLVFSDQIDGENPNIKREKASHKKWATTHFAFSLIDANLKIKMQLKRHK
jgi:hypothetical protein